MATYATAQAIVDAALQELGMGTVNLLAAANDATGYQMLGLLNALGQELLRMQDWQQFIKEFEIIGDGTSNSWGVPDDWGRQVNQTQWAASDQRPMIGPVSSQQWAWNQFGLVSAGMLYQYRVANGQFNTFPILGAGETVKMYYIIKNWVALHGNYFDASDRVINPDDICGFDERLLIAGLKLKFWAIKGLDTTVLAQEYDTILNNEKAVTGGAPVLYLAGGPGTPLINWGNVPDGNVYGV